MSIRVHDQHGATAVIVGISLFLLFAAGAIAIDLGGAFDTKRDLITDTDSAAFSAALTAAIEGCTDSGASTAKGQAAELLTQNLGRTVTEADLVYECDTPSNIIDPNTVSVGFTDAALQTLSPALDINDLDVFARSVVEFNGYGVGGLRPIAVCAGDVTSIPGATIPGEYASPIPMLLSMGKTWKNATCGGGDGNWGYLCFDVATCNENAVENWMDVGFERDVDLGTALGGGAPHPYNPPAGGTDEDCDPDAGTSIDWCEIRSGNSIQDTPSESAIMNSLIGETFAVLVTDCIGQLDASDTCVAGSNAHTDVHPYAFLYVIMDDWCIAKNNVANSVWHSASPPYTNQQCLDNSTGNKDLVLALRMIGTTTAGIQTDFFNPLDPAVQQCGVDNDPDGGNRCDRNL